MRNTFCLFLLLALFSCTDTASTTASATSVADTTRLSSEPGDDDGGQAAAPPAPATEAPETKGKAPNDLNGDGETDRLKVVTTKEDNDGLGFKRRLVVYSGEGADLDAWYTAEEVILSTEHGGMMGDPLESVEIENGTIVIKHFGGSRTKWHYTHRFRWQNGDFQLIGTTIEYNDNCALYSQLDYNLSTGKAVYSTTPQDCSGDELKRGNTSTLNFSKKTPLPSMDGFATGEHEIKVPEMEDAVYF